MDKNINKKIKLLILTQRVDVGDSVLGFMHGWIKEFAKHCDKVTVICLYKGEYELPNNVKVLSLGKENLEFGIWSLEFLKKLKYILIFYKYIWRERSNYDRVFVHMNREYVVLGGALWRCWGKKVALWYNHSFGNFITRLAMKLAQHIFYVSPFAFTAKSRKSIQMPAGVDMEVFKRIPHIIKKENALLYLGRISPVKRLATLISAAVLLDRKGIDFELNIYGEAATESDKDYKKKIEQQAGALAGKKIFFHEPAANIETPQIYNKHQLLINLTQSGSFDKTIMEAMACEVPTIVSNQSLRGVLPEELLFKESNAQDLADKISAFLKMPEDQRAELGKKLKQYVADNHNLKKLIIKLTKIL